MSDPMNRFSLYRPVPLFLEDRYSGRSPKQPPRLIRNKIARHILTALAFGAGGALITMSAVGAAYFMVHGTILLALKDTEYRREVKKLQKQGYVALVKRPDGLFLKLLKKAKNRVRKILIEDIKLPSPVKWDGKWRLYTFDIPEKERISRNLLRRKLKELGMFNIQRSVFAYPYDCRPELEFISEHYKIAEHSAFMEVGYTDIDKELRQFFHLSRVKVKT